MNCKCGLYVKSNQYVATVAFFILVTLTFGVNPAASDTVIWSYKGGAGIAPPNTIEGMNLAFDMGASGAEIDLWHAGATLDESIDREIVLRHDRAVDATTNGTGQIQNLTPEYLRTLDAGSKNGTTRFPGARIPTLHEALNTMKARDKAALLHIKTSPWGLPGTVPTSEIAQALADTDFPEDQIYTWTHDHELIEEYVEGIPGLQVIYQGNVDPDTVVWQDLIDLGVKGIMVRLDRQQVQGGDGGEFNQAFIDDIHANGMFAFMNGIKENEFRQAIDWDVDFVMTHKIDSYMRILDASSVPEPGSLALLSLLSVCGLAGRRNRRRPSA